MSLHTVSSPVSLTLAQDARHLSSCIHFSQYHQQCAEKVDESLQALSRYAYLAKHHHRAHVKAGQLVDSSLALDIQHVVLYCHACHDCVYHLRAEAIFLKSKRWIYDVLQQKVALSTKQSHHIPFKPSTLATGSTPDRWQARCSGLRGLRNLGSTCFMNVILQALAHNPYLRNYFLCHLHSAQTCSTSHCLACEMDVVVTKLYSSSTLPFGPGKFLYTVWLFSKELAGYAQRDAHEFFISVLNQIHSTLGECVPGMLPCIIHQTFGGILQSKVCCLNCSNITTVCDPILDISLDLHSGRTPLLSNAANPFEAGTNGTTHAKSGGAGSINSLADCLNNFTRSERLGVNEYHCSHCQGVGLTATKKLLFKKLPNVLSIQFKRFGQSVNGHDKIESFVRFPSQLNMAPYVACYQHHAASSNDSCSYSLFAVINHRGSLETGHYTLYALHRNQWFCFDDHTVTLSRLEHVLASQAYMCFYAKDYADYTHSQK